MNKTYNFIAIAILTLVCVLLASTFTPDENKSSNTDNKSVGVNITESREKIDLKSASTKQESSLNPDKQVLVTADDNSMEKIKDSKKNAEDDF